MSDWQVGDLALCVAVEHPRFDAPSSILKAGAVYTVERVGRPVHWAENERALGLREVKPKRKDCGFPESLFRKIRPDEREACEPEFVQLLNRSKRKVSA